MPRLRGGALAFAGVSSTRLHDLPPLPYAVCQRLIQLLPGNAARDYVADEGAVDFELVERQASQVTQAGVAGAEIIY